MEDMETHLLQRFAGSLRILFGVIRSQPRNLIEFVLLRLF